MINHALKALVANRFKTALIYLSLVFTIVSIFLISSISSGVINMYSNMLKTDGDIIVTQANISDTFFSNVDIKLSSKIRLIDGINDVSSMIVGALSIENLPIVAIYGVSLNRFKNYSLIKGNYPKQEELIVGQSIYNNLVDKSTVIIANKKFKISGVFKSDIGFENGGIVLNINQAGKIFNKSASFLMVNTNINTKTHIDTVINQIKLTDKNIDVKSTTQFVDNYNQFKIIKTSSNIISLVAFAMGLLSISSIMSITINQRQSEFGIKKALGISTSNIVFTIMLESFILGVISFVSALIISQIILYGISISSHLQGYVNGEITFSLALIVFITSIAMAIIGAIIPAINGAKTDPIILIQGSKI